MIYYGLICCLINASRGRAYRSREDLYSDKIEIGLSKSCPHFDQNHKPGTGMHFMKIRLSFLIEFKFFSAGTFSIIIQTMFKKYFWS